jgi:hypothetical protein
MWSGRCAAEGGGLPAAAWVEKQRTVAMLSLRAGEVSQRVASTYRVSSGVGRPSSFGAMRSVPSFSGTALAGRHLWAAQPGAHSFVSVAPGSSTVSQRRTSLEHLGATDITVPCEACGEDCQWLAANACSIGLVLLATLLASGFTTLLAARAQCEALGRSCNAGVLQYTFVFLPLWALVLLSLGALLAVLMQSASRIDQSVHARRRHSESQHAISALFRVPGGVLCVRSALTCGADGLDLAVFTPARTALHAKGCRDHRILILVLVCLAVVVQLAVIFAALSAGQSALGWLPSFLPLWGALGAFSLGHVALVPSSSIALQLCHRSSFLLFALAVALGALRADSSSLLGGQSDASLAVAYAPFWAAVLPATTFLGLAWFLQARAVKQAAALKRRFTGRGGGKGAVAPQPSHAGVAAAVALSKPSLVPEGSAAAAIGTTRRAFVITLSLLVCSALHLLRPALEEDAPGSSWYIVALPLVLVYSTVASSALVSI